MDHTDDTLWSRRNLRNLKIPVKPVEPRDRDRYRYQRSLKDRRSLWDFNDQRTLGTERPQWSSDSVLIVNDSLIARHSLYHEEPVIQATSARPSVSVGLVMLFYRYMLPHVTSEVYSWADPENANSGFKTGVENGLSSWRKPSSYQFPSFSKLSFH